MFKHFISSRPPAHVIITPDCLGFREEKHTDRRSKPTGPAGQPQNSGANRPNRFPTNPSPYRPKLFGLLRPQQSLLPCFSTSPKTFALLKTYWVYAHARGRLTETRSRIKLLFYTYILNMYACELDRLYIFLGCFSSARDVVNNSLFLPENYQ